MASKIGGQKVLGASMFLGSLMTLLVPVSANWGYEALIACRFLNGLVHVNKYSNITKKNFFNIFFRIFKGAVWPVIIIYI